MAAQAIEKVGKNVKHAVERVGNGDSTVDDPKRIAIAGVAIAAVPLVAQGISKLGMPKPSDKVSELADAAKEKAAGDVRDGVKSALPSLPSLPSIGGDDSDDEGAEGRAAPGHGSGRRMPIQQAIDVAVPIKAVYDHWTRFEDWPEFMHRVESVEQVDDATVAFETKIWGIRKRFEADIVEQRPDERIEWNVTQGYAHTGVVTFHPLSDNLTRIDLTLDVNPSNIVDKMSRGMRFVKRAVRADLHRFKAYAELDHEPERGWRGTIEEGKVKRARSSGARPRSGSRRPSRNGHGARNGARAKTGS
jgi:uncharacterized membrane protein